MALERGHSSLLKAPRTLRAAEAGMCPGRPGRGIFMASGAGGRVKQTNSLCWSGNGVLNPAIVPAVVADGVHDEENQSLNALECVWMHE